MLIQLLASYLSQSNRISKEQLKQVVDMKNKLKLPLGQLAIENGLLTNEQVLAINNIQRVQSKRFGDIVIESKYLTADGFKKLLSLQPTEHSMMHKAFSEGAGMDKATTDSSLAEFIKHYNLSDEDINALCNYNMRVCVEKIGKVKDDLFADYAVNFANLIVRLIDRNPMVLPCADCSESYKYIATQSCVTNNNETSVVGFATNTGDLVSFAKKYYDLGFDSIDEDCQDVSMEFLNCAAGMFVREIEKNRKLDYDLLPPSFGENKSLSKAKALPILTQFGEFFIIYK